MTDSDKVIKIFGRKIRKARKEKGLTQRELAESMNVNHACISYLEIGKHATNLCSIMDIHRGLGVPLWGLLPTEDEMNMTEAELMQLLEGE